MNINNLPKEALSRIFKELHPWDWLKCELVCKSWCEILRQYWSRVDAVEYESCGEIHLNLHGSRSYQLMSYGSWEFDDANIRFLFNRCGDYLRKLSLHIAPTWSTPLTPETILLVGASCRHLKTLSLNGYVSSVADSVSVIAHDLLELEELDIWDENFPDEATGEMNSSIAVGDIISSCRQLRVITIVFYFIPPPSEDTCRRMSTLEHLERIRWLIWNPLAPAYVESFLSSLAGCGRTLRELNFGCKLKSALDSAACARALCRLSEACPGLEIIDLGFQLHKAIREEGSDEVFYEPLDLAPWTYEILSALTSFHGVRELSLRHFELFDDDVLEAFKALCANVETLRIEDNYGVTGKLIWVLGKAVKQLRSLSISQACLSHADLVELIQRCPKLTMLRLSNVEGMSFKRLVLDTHAVLHQCGYPYSITAGHGDVEARRLTLELNTARNYIHEEAEELKWIQLCGLTLSPLGHSSVVIDKVCRKIGVS